MRRKLLYILSLPYVLALPVTFIIALFIPVNNSKFSLSIEEKVKLKGHNVYYFDLNTDGVSEKIFIGSYRQQQVFADIRTLNNSIYDQWNGKYAYVPDSPVISADYDNDGKMELCTFSYKDDSVFLNIMEFFDESGIHLKGRFIDVCKLNNGKIDYDILENGVFDGNKDGFKDIYFTVRSGFTLRPRRVYRYDVENDSLLKSDNLGNIFFSHVTNKDVTGDGIPEVFGCINAMNNYPDSVDVPYRDKDAWAFVFDHNLDFLFPPVKYKDPLSRAHTLPFITSRDTFVAVFYWYIGTMNKEAPRLDIYTTRGNLSKQFNLKQYGEGIVEAWNPDSSYHQIYFKFNSGKDIFSINQDMEITKIATPGFNWDYYIKNHYIASKTGKPLYFIFNSLDNHIHLYDHRFNNMTAIHVPFGNSIADLQHVKADNGDFLYYMKVNLNHGIILKLHRNGFQLATILVPGIIYLLVTGLLYSGRWIYQVQARQKQQTLQQLTKFQMLAVKNQLDPHFAFNAVNTLGSLIYGDNKEKAYNYLLRFSNLLRNQLTSSDKLLVHLEDEIGTTRDFLILQSERFRNKLRYTFDISPEVNQQMLVPRLCIQTYVENAIKHGLKPRGGEGEVRVSIIRENHFIVIEIVDNGIGRAQAKHSGSFSTGKGLASMEKLYAYINKESKEKIEFRIEDLFDEKGRTEGTRVWLKVPEGLREQV